MAISSYEKFRAWVKAQSLLWQLILVNAAIFLLLSLVGIVDIVGGLHLHDIILEYALALPSSLRLFIIRPWTLLTYMFTQYAVLHILFNMLTLYWFGTLFQLRCTPRQLLGLYVYGGVAGGLLYMLCALALPTLAGCLVGASASVIAIVIATAVIMPDYEINLLLIGAVKMKWVAIAAAVMFALGLVGNNAGGHVAHIGGMLMGIFFGVRLNRGHDITAPLNRFIDKIVNIFKHKKPIRRPSPKTPPKKPFGPKTKAEPTRPATEEETRQRLDEILDKIRVSGYTSLTPQERRILFEISKKLK